MEDLQEKIRQQKCRIGIWFFYIFFDIAVIVSCIRDSFFKDLCHQMVLVSVCLTLITFSNRFSYRYQSYMLMFGGILNTIVASMHEGSFTMTIITVIGCTVVFSVYKDEKLVMTQAAFSLLILFINAFWMENVPMTTYSEIVSFIFLCIAYLVVALFLCNFLVRQKRIEKELRETARKALAAEKAKAEFLAHMSHEIRTPMNSIIGMCELVLRQDDLSEEARECCGYIQTSSQSLLGILNDILDFSKLESGKVNLVEKPFQVRTVLDDIINMTYIHMGKKNLEFLVRVSPKLPCVLVGDELRIRQIIMNLLTNAVKFTDQGMIKLEVSMASDDHNGTMPALRIAVRDTGIGIPREELPRLFSSFLRLDTINNYAVEGTGLGLAITKGLLDCMGGTIDVDSEYHQGTTFVCHIPIRIADPDPVVKLPKRNPLHIAGYICLERIEDNKTKTQYSNLQNGFENQLETDFQILSDPDVLKEKVKEEQITDLFIGREEYLSDREYFDMISEEILVYLILDRTDDTTYGGDIRCIRKPFYSIPLAAALNNEKNVNQRSAKERNRVAFTIPDKRVLVVDDNEVNLRVARGLLQPYRAEIVTANNGTEALDMIRCQHFDMVLMDHMMPGMDGVKTVEKIRGLLTWMQHSGDMKNTEDWLTEEYLHNLPIIALTANAVNGAEQFFLESGFQDYLPKPIEPTRLEEILGRWIQSEEGTQCEEKLKDAEGSLGEEELKDAEGSQGEKKRQDEDGFAGEEEVEEFLNGDAQVVLDDQMGLHYCDDDMEDYLEILNIFNEAYDERKERLKNYYDNHDWENYVIEVHALKSSSYTIGAKMLGDFARKLEFAGRDRKIEEIEKYREDLLDMYHEVVGLADRYVEEQRKINLE